MGIYDRDYYGGGRRGGHSSGLPRVSFRPRDFSINSWLIIINIAVFLLNLALPVVDIKDGRVIQDNLPADVASRVQEVDSVRPPSVGAGGTWTKIVIDPASNTAVGFDVYRSWHVLEGYGHFSLLKGFQAMEVWRLITFQFLHADLTHLFFNMFGLFIFGGMVEQYLGRKRYLAYYLVCGISGGVMYMMLAGLDAMGVPLPGTLSVMTNWQGNELLKWTGAGRPLIGASAGVFGVIVACARIAPDMRVMLIFPPIPLKMKWMAYGYVAIAAINLLNGGGNAGGDAAHIGGAIAGFYFIRNQHLLRGFLDFGVGAGPKSKGAPRKPKSASKAPSQSELDRILDKVNREGIHKLTPKEKKTLERASREARDGG